MDDFHANAVSRDRSNEDSYNFTIRNCHGQNGLTTRHLHENRPSLPTFPLKMVQGRIWDSGQFAGF